MSVELSSIRWCTELSADKALQPTVRMQHNRSAAELLRWIAASMHEIL